jgi:beta-lactamase regulating signal transducer with metallopeptidase domain
MNAPGIQLIAQLVAESVLNSITGGVLIAAFAWLLLRLVGKQNSGTRFAVWFSALIAIAGLPFVPRVGHVGAAHAMPAEIVLPGFWAYAIFALWISFVALATSRLILGLWSIRRLRRSGLPLEPSQLHPALSHVLARYEAVRPVRICSSSTVKVPTAIGFFQPLVLIPDWALRDLPAEELKVILLHELAHLRRWDDWTNLAQKIVRTVFFFHPAVWWIETKISLEREMACDDAVLAETGSTRAYAECLVSLAEKSFVQRTLAMAQAAIGRARETSARLAHILDVDRPRATRVFKPALGVTVAFLGAILIVLPNAPRLVTFENAVQPYNVAGAGDEIPRRMPAHVVPVTFRTATESASGAAAPKVAATRAAHHLAKAPARKLERGEVLEAAVEHRQQDLPPFSAVPVAAGQKSQLEEFFVVMHTAEFDERGSVTLSVSVWRVKFPTSPAKTVQQQVLAKST